MNLFRRSRDASSTANAAAPAPIAAPKSKPARLALDVTAPRRQRAKEKRRRRLQGNEVERDAATADREAVGYGAGSVALTEGDSLNESPGSDERGWVTMDRRGGSLTNTESQIRVHHTLE